MEFERVEFSDATGAVARRDSSLAERYRAVRAYSLQLAAGLSAEDQSVQSMADASPTKWHLAHTTWFFETLVLQAFLPDYRAFDPRFATLFNSYYESLGPRHPRPRRGLLTRPALETVLAYRAAVDNAMLALLTDSAGAPGPRMAAVLELGLNHEQQHQELLLTDILHAFSCNPLYPAVFEGPAPAIATVAADGWLAHAAGKFDIGHVGNGFAFDNEGPCHAVWLDDFEIARALVTNAQYQQFVDDGGYREPRWWLSDGWALVCQEGWRGPLYWLEDGLEFGLHGVQPRQPLQAVRHLSYYEAAAFAEWSGARLPSEAEWEVAAAAFERPDDLFGKVWQWSGSAYSPYPRFRPAAGAVGEYNGKFMVGQWVLRGSSLATPAGHARHTYRNFFAPACRWQFSGLRLARDP